MAEPHWVQNRMEGSFGAPQTEQVTASGAPQVPQKREASGLSAPQFEQVTRAA
jgi:hypothetical protein